MHIDCTVHSHALAARCIRQCMSTYKHRLAAVANAHQLTCDNLTIPTHNVRDVASNSRSYNYIFKVLFTTPSWYLFSIGFGHISVFRWGLAPLRIPFRRNTTLAMFTGYDYKRVVYGAITLIRYVLQINYTCTIIGNTFHATYYWTCH